MVDPLQFHLVKVPHQACRLRSLRSLCHKVEVLKERCSLWCTAAVTPLPCVLLAHRRPVLL
jgi:hypothetical protein